METAPFMNLAQLVKQMTPVFVVAPTARNGITLIQRLLNTTRQIIVYGENTAFVQTMPSLVHSAVQTHVRLGPEMEETRKRFLHETTEFWSSGLWPDTNRFQLLAFEAFYKMAAHYQGCTEDYGHVRWGLKNPMDGPQMIERLQILMPAARFVFIYRDLFDVARSAKSRQFIRNSDDLVHYARTWRENLTAVLADRSDRVCALQYEDLLARPEHHIPRLEQFAGVTGIDAGVLDRKINTFDGPEDRGLSPTGYVEPQTLSGEEIRTLREHAAPALELGGYARSA